MNAPFMYKSEIRPKKFPFQEDDYRIKYSMKMVILVGYVDNLTKENESLFLTIQRADDGNGGSDTRDTY